MFQPDGDPETVSQKNASLDGNGFPRIAGLSSEQHTFTADIAFSQVLLAILNYATWACVNMQPLLTRSIGPLDPWLSPWLAYS